jgi:hypothetical protein
MRVNIDGCVCVFWFLSELIEKKARKTMEETLQRLSLPAILGLAVGAAVVFLLVKYPGEPLKCMRSFCVKAVH